MIIPVGHLRRQEKQGQFRNETVLEQFRRMKEARTPLDSGEINDSPEDPAAVGTVDDAMAQSSNANMAGSMADDEAPDIRNENQPPPGQADQANVTQQAQRITNTVQKALGLDPAEGWTGDISSTSGPGGDLTSITIKLTKQRRAVEAT